MVKQLANGRMTLSWSNWRHNFGTRSQALICRQYGQGYNRPRNSSEQLEEDARLVAADEMLPECVLAGQHRRRWKGTADILSARCRRDKTVRRSNTQRTVINRVVPLCRCGENRFSLIDHCSSLFKRSADAYGNAIAYT